jgi:ferric-dicitrate binding protein FerR (iron transport regulator)
MRKQALVWASAAAVVLAVFVTTIQLRQADLVQPIVVASVEKQLGEVFVEESGAKVSLLAVDTQLLAGSGLSTARESRLALAWVNGESVRVDEDSLLTLDSDTEISLIEGRIYVDSREGGAGDAVLTIQTPSGPVRHVGTQYITDVHGGEVTVSVREGKVAIGGGDDMRTAAQGQRIQVTQTGEHTTTAIATYGDDWQWAELVAPRFDTDGRSVREFLEWVGRETGRRIEYGSVAAETMAAETRLHGNVDLEPLQAMQLMLQTSDLIPSVRDGVILVSF